MHPRHPPHVWLMTDERLGDALWPALRRLPPGGGVVFRHGATPRRDRLRLFLKVRRAAHARRQVVVSARTFLPGADGVHAGHGGTGGVGAGRGGRLRTAPAHDRREALVAHRSGATVVFVSPVHPTRSHPGKAALGPMRAARIARGLGLTVIALGGMNAGRWRRIRPCGFDGWAGIDAWL